MLAHASEMPTLVCFLMAPIQPCFSGPSPTPPQIRSGATIVMLDPNRAFLAPQGNPGKRYDVTHPGFSQTLERYADSFAMLDLWGAGPNKEYNGAIRKWCH